jgi:hypothetical protein
MKYAVEESAENAYYRMDLSSQEITAALLKCGVP